MKRTVVAVLILLVVVGSSGVAQETSPSAISMVEVVFVLDATGSMGGLIEGAKQKIWSIANSVVELRLAPRGRIGLVAYRDRGDEYITRVYEFTEDLDAVFRDLQTIYAGGGGDGPESVNQALNEAVHDMGWSPGGDVLRIVFLVGDAPPHMDYHKDVHYPETCAHAVEAGIIVNTLQCGNHHETRVVWREIAALGQGEYVSLPQSGNMTVITTPYDDDILGLTADLNQTVVLYGSPELQDLTESKLAASVSAPAGVAADRAAYNLSTGGKVVQGRGDLVADWQSGIVDLNRLDSQALPVELRRMTDRQLEQHLEEMQHRRDALNFELADLNGDRAAFIDRERRRMAGGAERDAFDVRVTEILAEQAARIR